MGFRSRMRRDASMTDRRDFKKRVRDRQAATGENYTTAREHVLAQRSHGAVPVVEMIDASEQAHLLGLRCPVLIARAVIEQLELVHVIICVRDALIACDGDPSADRLSAVVLHGEPLPPRRDLGGESIVGNYRRFYARARAGVGGFDARGMQLALHIDGESVICALSTRAKRAVPASLTDRELVLMIDLIGEALDVVPMPPG